MPTANPKPNSKKVSENSLRRPRKNTTVDAQALPAVPKTSTSPILILLIPLVFILGLGAGYLIWGSHAGASVNSGFVLNLAEDDPSIGPANAPVTIVEFSDYQCPYCKNWYDETFNRLLTEYAGKIRFVYRDFPLYSIHPGAEPAAEAADCAQDQNAYWKYHDALFSGKYDLTSEGFQKYAAELGLDTNAFANCLSSQKYRNEVSKDSQDGASFGVTGTPTFFINGFQLVGAQPYEAFKQVIDQILAGENTK
jgi:protein-disulfide isomerase